MTDQPATIGVLLAGGLARRMGGGDKSLRMIGGQTILNRIITRVQPQCRELVLNANGDASRFAQLNLPIIPDTLEDNPGPLAGILAAMDWTIAHRPDVEWLFSTSTDCPFLPHNLVSRLHEARAREAAQIIAASSGDHIHHVIALWHIGLRDDLASALTHEGLRKVERWTARHKRATVTWPSKPFDPFFNINTAEDMRAAEDILALDQN